MCQDILLSSTPTSLRRLHFFNNMSGDGGARALAEVMTKHFTAVFEHVTLSPGPIIVLRSFLITLDVKTSLTF